MREIILETVSDQPGIEIVGEVQNDAEIAKMVEQTRPDFVIVALEETGRLSPVCYSVLEEHPNIKILAIAPERGTTMFYWTSLAIHSNPVEGSGEGVLSALRGKLHSVGGNA